MTVRAGVKGVLGMLVLLAPGLAEFPGGIQTARAESESTPWQTTVAASKIRSRPVKNGKHPASASPLPLTAGSRARPKPSLPDGTAREGAPGGTSFARQMGIATALPIETGSVEGAQEKPAAAPASLPQPVAAKDTPPGLGDSARRFCLNIKPQVEELRTALQKKKLMQAEAELQKRITQLEARIGEYKEWMERRQDFINKVQDSLVKIYSKMRPEAVAQQLPSLDLETAAAVLLKLEPRTASAILNDTDPKLAATLASIISSSAKPSVEPEKTSAQTP